MLRFKQFLKEGGNWLYSSDKEEQKRVADPIETKNRDVERGHLHDMFHSIDKGFAKKHGHNLFGNALKKNTFASGSAEVYSDPNVSTERLKKFKPTLGDFDVQIPEEHHQKLREYLKPGQTHGKFKVLHLKTNGPQTHIIVQHQDTGKHHQIDFEPVEYDKDTKEPSAFEKFAHSSHVSDLEQGLKGVHHKLLAQSVMAAHSQSGIISKMAGRGKARAETQEEGTYSPYSFSVDKGLREKWEKVGEKDGKPIVREKAPKDSTYTKDLPTIYKTMFNREPSEQDVKDIHSFDGLVTHIKKHIPQEKHGHIFGAFVNKLWHPSAQETSIDPKKDKEVKENAYKVLANHFPREHLDRQEKTEKLKSDYYDPNNPKKFKAVKINNGDEPETVKESDDDVHHVVFSAGRFTGPTVEHHKLLSKVFNTKADSHRVYVMGPATKEETTAKDPLTVDEKINSLKKLYPEHSDSFIAGTERHTKNPAKAVMHTWHSLKKPGKKINLTVIAGSGNEGIKNKSSAGGSLESYKTIIDKYNRTNFPRTENPDGTVRGGDLRMDYDKVNYEENPRGTVSGTVMRKAAVDLDHENPEHVKQFKKYLHPDSSEEDAKNLMKKIKDRSSGIKEAFSLIESIRSVLIK